MKMYKVEFIYMAWPEYAHCNTASSVAAGAAASQMDIRGPVIYQCTEHFRTIVYSYFIF